MRLEHRPPAKGVPRRRYPLREVVPDVDPHTGKLFVARYSKEHYKMTRITVTWGYSDGRRSTSPDGAGVTLTAVAKGAGPAVIGKGRGANGRTEDNAGRFRASTAALLRLCRYDEAERSGSARRLCGIY